ncbi:MAG: hypothetical protein AAGG07_05585 [Planctomycetota bacterium]
MLPWCFAQSSEAQQGRPKLGILSVEATDALLQRVRSDGHADDLSLIVDALDGQLINAFQGSRRFEIIARSDLEVLLKEQDLQQAVGADPVRVLATAGCDYGVAFTIDAYRDEYVDQKLTTPERRGKIARARRTIYVSVVAKIYDVEKGSLLESAAIEYASEPFAREYGSIGADTSLVREQMADMLDGIPKSLAESVARRVMYVLYPARVLRERAGQVFLNWGDGTGIRSGQEWDVFLLEEVEGFDYEGQIERIETKVGRVRIESVTATNSTARVLEDFGIERGCVARLDEEHEIGLGAQTGE